ncbi:MAG: hypothetical protein ISR50_04825 [Alphaproteobacteria bacterium]|nr:hypothetical protein [Alphaproteobacteria bacterium]
MNSHRYPMKALAADYMRSAFGVLLPAALMLFTNLIPVVFYSMGALILLFAGYGLRTAWRHGTVLTVDGNGVRQEGLVGGFLDREIGWAEMRDFRLRYYSTQRDRTGGWMQLILRGGENRGVIRMDSHLPGFDDIVRQAHAATQNNGLALDPTTAANLSSLGLTSADPGLASTQEKSPS